MTVGERIAAFRTHVRALWPRSPLLPVAPFAAFALYQVARGDLRPEHLLLLGVVAALAYIGPRSKELLVGLYPFALVAIFFDGMRPIQRLGLSESRVLLCDLREVERTFFGLTTAGGERITLHDYFYVHHWPAIDLLCAIPYATFILACVVCALYLHRTDRPAMLRFAWGFFLLNVAGFITYHLLPAAPPWYFHAHGCQVDLATRASEGPALMRVDAMLGVSYFKGMYGKASSVFGALPSLHCAYPLLIVIQGFRTFGWKLRVAAVLFYAWMVFSAVYLDHHWVLDALLGSLYAVLVSIVLAAISRAWRRRQGDGPPPSHEGLRSARGSVDASHDGDVPMSGLRVSTRPRSLGKKDLWS